MSRPSHHVEANAVDVAAFGDVVVVTLEDGTTLHFLCRADAATFGRALLTAAEYDVDDLDRQLRELGGEA